MRFYFKITPLRTDDDFVNLSNVINEQNQISTSELTNDDKCYLIKYFDKAISEDPYYQEGKRHFLRRNAVRAVEIFFEMQTDTDVSIEDVKRWRKLNIEWVFNNAIGFNEDYLLYEGIIRVNGVYAERFVYIPIDENGAVTFRKFFKCRFPYLFNSYKKMVSAVYNSSLSRISLIHIEQERFDKAPEIISEQKSQIYKLENENRNLKAKLYDYEMKLKNLSTIEEFFKDLKDIVGESNFTSENINQMVTRMVIMEHAYKMYKALNMEQECSAFENAKKYALIYFNKHPEEKTKYTWLKD